MEELFAGRLFVEALEDWEGVALGLLKNLHQKYPFDVDKDLELLRTLHDEFPQVDIVNEIKQWRVWLLDNPPKGKWNWRARLRRWVKNSDEWRTESGGNGRGRAGVTRRHNAAPAAVFGSTGTADKW